MFRRVLVDGGELIRHAVPQLAHLRRGGDVWLFASGRAIRLAPGLEYAGALIAGPLPLEASTLGSRLDDQALLRLLADLVNDGVLEIQPALTSDDG